MSCLSARQNPKNMERSIVRMDQRERASLPLVRGQLLGSPAG